MCTMLQLRTPCSHPYTVVAVRGRQSNPTYLLSGGERRYVLRKKPPGKVLASAHAVEREFTVISALARSSVNSHPFSLIHVSLGTRCACWQHEL